MDKEFREFCDLALARWGEDAQIRMCIEEMSELTKELCKYDRTVGTDKEQQTIAAIKEEIADVLNMVEQLQFCNI